MCHAIEAAVIVERLFPPSTPRETFCILASLNLLNTVVKRPWGARLVCYNYIKGMAARLFVHLCHHPQKHTSVFHDQTERVTYFRVYGVQISFHFLPHSHTLYRIQNSLPTEVQTWDGIRLQEMSVEFFRLALPYEVAYTEEEAWNARSQMLHLQKIPHPVANNANAIESPFRQRHRLAINQVFTEDKTLSLRHALSFNIWNSQSFILFRRKDQRAQHFMRYNGENYQKLLQFTIGTHPKIPRRKETSLEQGKFYHISPQMRLRALPLSNYIFTLTQNCYLVHEGNFSNLCLTYGIALYLSSRFPDVLFVNTLEYNRRLNIRKYYTYDHLLSVPLGADERRLKVWITIDTTCALAHFSPKDLPQPLVEEYLAAEDFYQEFQYIRCAGLLGIIAYRRHLLLPPLYTNISIHNYHAHVMRPDGKWAIYSLAQEHFISDFIYDRIWYDHDTYTIYGEIQGCRTTIYSFFPKSSRTFRTETTAR